MLKPEQIPDEVVEASAIVLMGQLMVRREDALHVWAGMHEPVKEQFRREARAAFVAGLKAWPGGAVCHYTIGDDEGYEMVLPLPHQEYSDE